MLLSLFVDLMIAVFGFDFVFGYFNCCWVYDIGYI